MVDEGVVVVAAELQVLGIVQVAGAVGGAVVGVGVGVGVQERGAPLHHVVVAAGSGGAVSGKGRAVARVAGQELGGVEARAGVAAFLVCVWRDG